MKNDSKYFESPKRPEVPPDQKEGIGEIFVGWLVFWIYEWNGRGGQELAFSLGLGILK